MSLREGDEFIIVVLRILRLHECLHIVFVEAEHLTSSIPGLV